MNLEHFWRRFKITPMWLFATFLVSMCSFCGGQHTDTSILIRSAFPCYLRGRQNSALIAIYSRLLLVASPLILGYDAAASSNSNNLSLEPFLVWDITSSACHLEKSFIYDETMTITRGHWNRCRSIGHVHLLQAFSYAIFRQLCSSWQDLNWHLVSRSPSVTYLSHFNCNVTNDKI